MMTDPIADFLTRLRNGLMAGHESISCDSSKMKVRIANILKEEGYVGDVNVEEDGLKKTLSVQLKYDANRAPIIEGIQRVSRPGLRIYTGSGDLPVVRGGIGVAIVSTSKGVMTSNTARKENVGGEVLCKVW